MLTKEQYWQVLEAMATWLRVRLKDDARYREIMMSADPEGATNALVGDLFHSALLYRLLMEGKPPLPERPPVEGDDPQYPD